MNKSISSSSLFHFTNSHSTLLSILRNGLFPRYSMQTLDFIPSPLHRFAFPMVSFCDLPLSQTFHHMAIYGRYGIGLSKEWGMKQGINPVLYCYPRSRLAGQISKALGKLAPDLTHSQKLMRDRKLLAQSIVAHMKTYRGTFKRAGRTHRNVTFYDEREWRFVPKNYATYAPQFLRSSVFERPRLRGRYNAALRDHCTLHFKPTDVRYLIVRRDSDISSLADHIARMNILYSPNQRKALISRIISSEQILHDF